VKKRHNSPFFVLLLTVSHFAMLTTQFLIQLFHHGSFICVVINRHDNWCSVESIFRWQRECKHSLE